MNQKTVRKLELELEKTIGDVVGRRLGLKAPLQVSWLLVLCLGLPAWAQGFKVYISTDMEGCSGVTCSEQVAAEEGKQLMTGDMNACIEGCFAAGATEVVIPGSSWGWSQRRSTSD